MIMSIVGIFAVVWILVMFYLVIDKPRVESEFSKMYVAGVLFTLAGVITYFNNWNKLQKEYKIMECLDIEQYRNLLISAFAAGILACIIFGSLFGLYKWNKLQMPCFKPIL